MEQSCEAKIIFQSIFEYDRKLNHPQSCRSIKIHVIFHNWTKVAQNGKSIILPYSK